MDFLDILREKAFLGREFPTWLWYKSERSAGRVELSDGSVMEVEFLDRMVLDLVDEETPQTVAIKGQHSELREGLAALREGKKIEEARLRVRGGDNDFTMVIKGTWFSFGSFRTPPMLPSDEEYDEGPEARFLEKAYLLEEGLGIVDKLFGEFVRLRISDQWELSELPAVRRWIEGAGD
jgi:recombination associated protein RdgC